MPWTRWAGGVCLGSCPGPRLVVLTGRRNDCAGDFHGRVVVEKHTLVPQKLETRIPHRRQSLRIASIHPCLRWLCVDVCMLLARPVYMSEVETWSLFFALAMEDGKIMGIGSMAKNVGAVLRWHGQGMRGAGIHRSMLGGYLHPRKPWHAKPACSSSPC